MQIVGGVWGRQLRLRGEENVPSNLYTEKKNYLTSGMYSENEPNKHTQNQLISYQNKW